MKITVLESDQEVSESFRVMKTLRPHLIEEEYLEKVRRQQRSDGYRLVAVLDGNDEISALAGFRVAEYMAWGKVLYIDDLITDPDRKRNGYGGKLLDWIEEEAMRSNCDEIHLDTGYGRHDAHRLYLKKGFILSSHHMSEEPKT